MASLERVQADMTAAMKAKDEARLDAIRMIKAYPPAPVLPRSMKFR